MKGEQIGVYVSKKILSINDASGVVTVSDTLTPIGNLYPTLEWNLTNGVTLMKHFRITASFDAKKDFVVDNLRDWYTETLLIHSQRRLDPNYLVAPRATAPLRQRRAGQAGLRDGEGSLGDDE